MSSRYDRLGEEVYGNAQDDTRVEGTITPVNVLITLVDTSVGEEITQDITVEDKILTFCMSAKGILEIADHLGYKEKKTVRKYLTPLIKQGRIAMTVPDKPNSKNQKYITIR